MNHVGVGVGRCLPVAGLRLELGRTPSRHQVGGVCLRDCVAYVDVCRVNLNDVVYVFCACAQLLDTARPSLIITARGPELSMLMSLPSSTLNQHQRRSSFTRASPAEHSRLMMIKPDMTSIVHAHSQV